jgi:hypothetical protein
LAHRRHHRGCRRTARGPRWIARLILALPNREISSDRRRPISANRNSSRFSIESFAVKASIAASILNLFRGNADADKVSGVILKIDDAGGDAIDLVAFSIWVSKQGKRLQDPTAFRLKRLRIECMFGSLAIARTQSTKPSSRA